jgi:RHS repeat-associated protein
MITAVSSAHTLSFAYDEEGRLATTTLDGVPTSYDYNGTMPMGDWTGTAFATGATETRQHVFGAGGEPLYLTVNGVSTYSHQDALGSTIALSSATAGSTLGKITAEFAYDAFGQPTVPVTSTFGYAGQRVDPTTGLVYDRARFYSPALGRFYAPDPIGYKGGSNLYAYVGNDPANLADPSGKCPWCVGAVIGFGVDLAVQLSVNGTYDWRQSLAATTVGALTGGASAFIGEAIVGETLAAGAARAGANGLVGAALGAGQAETLNLTDGQNNNVLASAAFGFGGGAVGSGILDYATSTSASAGQAAFDALNTSDKLAAITLSQTNPGLDIGTARPAIVSGANAVGTAIGDAIGDVPTDKLK